LGLKDTGNAPAQVGASVFEDKEGVVTLKLTKADWDACLDDDQAWQGVCMDDVLLEVYGEDYEELPEGLSADVTIKVKEGVVVTQDDMQPVKSLVAFLRAWIKRRGRRQVVVDIPSELSDKALREALKPVGGNIV